MSVLLDTTIASLIHPKRKTSPLRALYAPHLQGHELAVSFQTQAELWAWAEHSGWGQKERAGLETFLARFVVIQHSADLGRVWARVVAQSRRVGRLLDAADAWIAATAVLHALPLITNDRDFVDSGVEGLEVVCYATPKPEPST